MYVNRKIPTAHRRIGPRAPHFDFDLTSPVQMIHVYSRETSFSYINFSLLFYFIFLSFFSDNFAVLIVAVVSDRAEGEEGVAEGDVPPLVDTFQAVTDDDVSLPPAQGAFETVMEDVSLVEEPSCSAESLTVQPPPASGSKNSSNGAKHPLKRLWKKATTKSSPAVAVDPASALSSPQPSDAEPSEQPTRFTSPQLLMSQQREDEMQLTLAEETDE